MAIESISYNEGFKIRLQWAVGVRGTVIYCVASGAGLADEGALMEAVRSGGLQNFNGFSYGSGTGSVSYAPKQKDLEACWVDICYCDYDGDYMPMRHECAGTFFNGMCKIGANVELIPISSTRQAVQITVLNKSKFPIGANGIGYTINGRVFGIPIPLDKGERKVLPQFDVGVDDTVKMCRMEGGYPAEFYKLGS